MAQEFASFISLPELKIEWNRKRLDGKIISYEGIVVGRPVVESIHPEPGFPIPLASADNIDPFDHSGESDYGPLLSAFFPRALADDSFFRNMYHLKSTQGSIRVTGMYRSKNASEQHLGEIIVQNWGFGGYSHY